MAQCLYLPTPLQSLNEKCIYDSFDDVSSYTSTKVPSFTFSSQCVPRPQGENSSARNTESDLMFYDKNGNCVNKHALSEHRHKKKESVLSQFNFDENGIGQSGHILSRTKKADLLFRRWKESYWVHIQPAILLMFRSKEDFLIWKGTSKEDRSRERLVMWAVNFDSRGVLKKKKKKLKKKLEKEKKEQYLKEGSSSFSSDIAKSNQAMIPADKSVLKYSMLDVHSKMYTKNRPILHGFKLERWLEVGAGVTAAFASSNAEEVKSLRKIIRSCIEMTSKTRKKK
mmetsp:Transcript_19758/g.29147  ORF Transcript_19758/g.29147 Transcript_19758/m.29147 type:complete len:283 (+) Transcript_19758:43-891(+)